MYKKRVSSILDYSIEGKSNENQFDDTLSKTLKVYDFAKKSAEIPFIVFKATGLGRFELFEKLSKDELLNNDEKKEWKKIELRFDKICKQCAQSPNIKVMIDAEESWIQSSIDKLVESMMNKYNKKRAVVFNTIQLYRWDRLDYLKYLHKKGIEEKYFVGVKLVRGAYMEKERKRAKLHLYKSPICRDKQATDVNFNNSLKFCLQHKNVFDVFIGTHNELSTQLLAKQMEELNIEKDDNKIWFGQLYGMSDYISFNLANKGYNTAKYLPFGPIKEVIPYLLRRAEENTSVNQQTSQELFMIKKEIARRHMT